MASKVRISLPPGLIEDARAAQYANRQRLSARTLETKLRDKIRKRIKLAEESELSSEKLIGGTLEFQEKNQYKIRTKRRPFLRGFLLVPDRDYDSEGKLYVRSEDGAVQRTKPGTLPFEFNAKKLQIKLADLTNISGNTQGQAYRSVAVFETSKLSETSNAFTFEFFVSLGTGPQILPTEEVLDEGYEDPSLVDGPMFGRVVKHTRYSCSISLRVQLIANENTVDLFTPIVLSKELEYNVPVTLQGIRSNWGLGLGNDRDQDTLLTEGGSEYHVAISVNQGVERVFFNGGLVRTSQNQTHTLGGAVIKSIFDALSWKSEQVFYGPPALYVPAPPPGPEVFSTAPPRSGFRCYRFTPGQALYQGTSFTPPTDITDLA